MVRILLLSLLILCLLPDVLAQKQTRDSVIAKQRVVETVQTNFVNDTALRYRIVLHYKYSGKRGSTFRPLDMPPGLGYGYQRFGNVWEEAELAELPEPFFNGWREDVQYDTVYDYQYTPGDTSSRLFKFRTYDNDTALRIRSEAVSLLNTTVVEREIIKDNNGVIRNIQCRSKQSNIPAPTILYTASLKYDSRGYISTDTVIRPSYTDTFARAYEHDAEGRITFMKYSVRTKQKPWQDASWHRYEYGTNGKLSSRIEAYRNQGSNKWDSTIRKIEYDSLNRLTTIYKITFLAPKPDTNTTFYHYNTEGDIDTMSLRDNNGTTFRTSYRYNEFHNPDTLWYHTIYRNGLQGQSNTMNVYKYELFYDTLKIDLPVSNQPLVLYPNPAGSKVTIRWNKSHPHQAVNILLYSVAGQFVRKYNLQAPGLEDTIDVSGFASGAYIIGITTLSGGKIHTQLLTIAGW